MNGNEEASGWTKERQFFIMVEKSLWLILQATQVPIIVWECFPFRNRKICWIHRTGRSNECRCCKRMKAVLFMAQGTIPLPWMKKETRYWFVIAERQHRSREIHFIIPTVMLCWGAWNGMSRENRSLRLSKYSRRAEQFAPPLVLGLFLKDSKIINIILIVDIQHPVCYIQHKAYISNNRIWSVRFWCGWISKML